MADNAALFGSSDSEGAAPQNEEGQAGAPAAGGDAEHSSPPPPAEEPAGGDADLPPETATNLPADTDAMRAAFGTDSEDEEGGRSDGAAATARTEPTARPTPPREGPPVTLAAPLLPYPPHPDALRLVRLSHLVGIEKRPFSAAAFEQAQLEKGGAGGGALAPLEGNGSAPDAPASVPQGGGADGAYVGGLGDVLAARARAGLAAAHTVRWRKRTSPGSAPPQPQPPQPPCESNARWVEWGDGSLQLLLGDGSAFDVRSAPIATEHLHLYADHGSVLQGVAGLATRLALTPAAGGVARGPAAERAVAAAAAARHPSTGPAGLVIGGGVGGGRAARVKPVATVTDPARAKAERERAEAEAARARDGLGRRQARARGAGGPAAWAGAGVGRAGRAARYSAAYLEALDEADVGGGSEEEEDGDGDGDTAADRARAELARGGAGGASARVAAAAAAAPAHRAGRAGRAREEEPDEEDAAFIVDDEDVAALAADGTARAPDEEDDDGDAQRVAARKSKKAARVALSDDEN